jgi:hypothetical protein
MTDDQIIQSVLDKINEWDNDTRNSPMFITNYIEEVYHLKERKSFELTTRMVKAKLVSQIRDNEYIMTDIGRQIADTPNGWLANKKTTYRRPTPLLDFLPTNKPQQYPTVTENKHEYVQKSSKLSMSNIFNWIWKITDHGLISGLIIVILSAIIVFYFKKMPFWGQFFK